MALKTEILDHVHTFVRWKKLFNEWHFRCADPDCMKVSPQSLLVGKRSICAICRKEEMILSNDDLRRAKPRCAMCSNTKEAIVGRRFKESIPSLFQDAFEENEEN